MDFKSYVEKKLLEITDLDERRVMREAVQDVLVQLHQTVQERADQLEEKVLAEETKDINRYEVEIGMVARERYDVTDKKMAPMLMRDIYEPVIQYQDVSRAIKDAEELYLFTVFVQADYVLIEKLIRTQVQFQGVIETDDGEYAARFILRPALEYTTKIKELYHAFVENGMKWNTPCSAYINKMFDVVLIGGDEVDGEDIRNITIDFGEYSPMIRYNMFPIWNIRMTKEKTCLYPVPCEGGKLFEHKIFKERLKAKDCLVAHDRARVVNLYKQEEDLVIVTDADAVTEWDLIHFMQEKSGYYEEPILSNCVNSWGTKTVRTMAELRRFIKDLGYDEYICLQDIVKCTENVPRSQMYLMDAFLMDELMMTEGLPVLLFQFKVANQGHYLNRDMLSYIITRVQWEYPQYKCVGVLQQ